MSIGNPLLDLRRQQIQRAVSKIMAAVLVIMFFIGLIFYCIGYYSGKGIERHDCFDAAGFPPPPAVIHLSRGE